MGVEDTHITGPDTSPAAIFSRVAGTTIPIGKAYVDPLL